MNPKLLKIILAVVIIIGAFLLIKSFLGTDSGSTISADLNNQVFVDDRSIVSTLNRLNKVNLDDSIFSAAIFTSLVNFERPIQFEPIGRPNPFAPIGSDGSGVVRSQATSTTR